MSRSKSVIVMPIAVGIAGVLALAGCSAGPGAAVGSESSAVAPFESPGVAPLAASDVAPLAASAVTPLVASNSAPLAASSVAADTDRNLITAQGVGKVSGTPDVVTIALGVETRSTSAQTALDDNNRLAADTIAVLKENGVAQEDLQTSQLSVYPSYDDQGKVTGYQVTNMVTVPVPSVRSRQARQDPGFRPA